MRVAGALVGLLGGMVVALPVSASGSSSFVSWRALGLVPALTLFGLLYDLLKTRYPVLWRSAVPQHVWMSSAFKGLVYWMVAYPVARVSYDLLSYAELVAGGDSMPLAVLYSHYAGLPQMVGFILFQSVFGFAFGIGFLILHSRLSAALYRGRGQGAKERHHF